ncbi:MAG TPA: glycerophosphodiester phosphodiesterase [Actinomycetes bacterium]|nr:glycerophosphodiester phosphodiesterase [Actinomycetes bacterium]
MAAALLLLALTQVAGAAAREQRVDRGGGRRLPLVIGHRGASGYRPEHTLASYRLAIEMGADYIEPDLVSTRDHVLVVRHENEISGTTDVAGHKEFEDRETVKTIDGIPVIGWFTEDFTLAELGTLRASERLPAIRPAGAAFDGRYHIPTFQQVIDLAKRRHVGIYPETKHPSYFRSIGLPLEEPLVLALDANGYRGPNAPVFVQSFEVANLERLRRMTEVPLVQLLDDHGRPYDLVASGDPRTYADLATPAGLAELAAHLQGIGPNKRLIVPRDASNRCGSPTALVEDAHRAGLLVHPWTFRRENAFLPEDFRRGDPASPAYLRAVGDLPAELRQFRQLGVDGLFSDNPDLAVAIRDERFGTGEPTLGPPGPLQKTRLGG